MFLAYYRLALKEERKMIELFGQRYLEYKESVPGFFPKFRKKKRSAKLLPTQ